MLKGHGAGQRQVVRIQKDFSLTTHLSDKEERSIWQQESAFPDGSIMERCLSSRAFCSFSTTSWPLLFDPYAQFEAYLRMLQVLCLTNRSQSSSSSESGVTHELLLMLVN